MHNCINYAFVIHLHPTLVNALTCTNYSAELTEKLFGDKALYIEYIDPGYVLFKEVEKRVMAYREKFGYDPAIIMLQNHCIFVSANNIEDIKVIYNAVFAKLEEQVKDELPEGDLPISGIVTEVIPALRMMVSKDGLKTIAIRNNQLINHFIKNKGQYSKISQPFTPDIIVYCKSKYIYIENYNSAEDLRNILSQEVSAFEQGNGYLPKVILIKGIGMVCIGDNANQCNLIGDVFEDLMKVSWLSESFEGPHFMTAEQIAFIDNWEVENYRRKVAAGQSSGRLENRIAIVTGGAQGFGEGLAVGLMNEGANVVVADMNDAVGAATVARLNQNSKSNKAAFVKCNVTDLSDLQNLMLKTVGLFGGLDLYVSNAGILRAGGLDEMTPETFDLVTKVNYNAYFYGTKAASAIMILQNQENPNHFADIIQINSKSGLTGSKKNFAYAGGKFGGIGLTQSFALELAPHRIKVNSICPGNFYEGPLWSDPENGLFVQYLNAGKVPGAKTVEDVKEFYMAQVPMKRGCSTEDVMKALLYLVEQEYETGQALPVTGGQTMLN